MVGVTMGDHDGVDLISWDVLQQSRQGRISQVEYESKVTLLNQKAAARLTCGGPSSARPQNSHSHRLTLGVEGLALSNELKEPALGQLDGPVVRPIGVFPDRAVVTVLMTAIDGLARSPCAGQFR